MNARNLILILASGLAACGAHRTPMKPTTVSIAGGRATFRDYRSDPARVCTAEPRWLLDELTAVNGMLRRFVIATEGDQLGFKQRRLLEEGAEVLPPVLEAHEVSLQQLDRCAFGKQGGFVAAVQFGKDRLREVRTLLEEAPQRIARAEAVEALKRWRREIPRMQLQAQAGCDRRNPRRIYFAWEQENGTRVFSFCDGASVTQRDGDRPLWLPPEGAPTRGRWAPKEKNYLEAVKSYALDMISRPPRVPEITASRDTK